MLVGWLVGCVYASCIALPAEAMGSNSSQSLSILNKHSIPTSPRAIADFKRRMVRVLTPILTVIVFGLFSTTGLSLAAHPV